MGILAIMYKSRKAINTYRNEERMDDKRNLRLDEPAQVLKKPGWKQIQGNQQGDPK